jgi:hypothetical protein
MAPKQQPLINNDHYFWIERVVVDCTHIHDEVVTCVAGSLEAVGLPGYPEVLFVEINMMKSCQSFVVLYFTQMWKTRGLKLYTKSLHV